MVKLESIGAETQERLIDIMKHRREVSLRILLELEGSIENVEKDNIKVRFTEGFYLYFPVALLENPVLKELVTCSIVKNGLGNKYIKMEREL